MKKVCFFVAVVMTTVVVLTGCNKKDEDLGKSIQFTIRGFVKTTGGQPIHGAEVFAEGWIMTGGGWRMNFETDMTTDYNGEVVLRDDYLYGVPDSMVVKVTHSSYKTLVLHPEVECTGESIGSWNDGVYECNFEAVMESK